MNKTIMILILMVPVIIMAQEAAPVVAAAQPDVWNAPEWFEKAMAYLESMPKIGHFVEVLVLWLGTIATVTTAVATAFVTIGKSLAKVLSLAKLDAAADKVEKYGKLIAPYLKYVSMYNVKKLPHQE